MTNWMTTHYEDGAKRECFDVDSVALGTVDGVCWLHIKQLDATDTHQDYALNVAGQMVNVRVMADGTARLNEPLKAAKG